MTRRVHIGVVLGVFLALNALFVLVLLWAYGVLLPGVVAGTLVYLQHGAVGVDLVRLPVAPSTALALVVAFLLAQLYYGYKRVLSGTHSGGAIDHDVARLVRRLAMTADVPEPAVRVVDADTPSCYTVGRFTDATIVLTTGLLETLDADELEGVLAHEIAHIKNRDVTLMTITTLFVELADRAYHASQLARRALFDLDALSTRGRVALQWFLPLVVLTYVFVAPLLWVFPTIAAWATRTLSHAREFGADRAGAQLTGKPLALATALLSLTDTCDVPATDLRAMKTRALCVVPTEPVNGVLARSLPALEGSIDDDQRRERVQTWLEGTTLGRTSDTHPPVDERIERLQALATELEGST